MFAYYCQLAPIGGFYIPIDRANAAGPTTISYNGQQPQEEEWRE